MRRSAVGHGRWATGVVAAVVVFALIGCGGASNRAAGVTGSEIDRHATLSSWKPQLPRDEKQRIDDCLGNTGETAYVDSRPREPGLVPLLPHLVYFARAAFGMAGGDAMVEVSMYIFDSPSTAARWVGIVSKEAFFRDIAHSEVRRVGSVVSGWYGEAETFGAYRGIAFACSPA
jgi:hypothetical protein